MSRRQHHTQHAAAYIEAWKKSRNCDKRSLMAHWQAGYTFAEYGDNYAEIAADVGISRSTVSNHISLYNAYPRAELLEKAAKKYDSFNYQFLTRMALGIPNPVRPTARIFACARCGCRELIEVEGDGE